MKEQGGLDDIAAVILPAEGHYRAATTIHEVRKMAMIASYSFEEVHHECEPSNSLLSFDPAVLRRDDDGHDPEARTASGYYIVVTIRGDADVVVRQPADGMTSVPKITKGLSLHEFKELRI